MDSCGAPNSDARRGNPAAVPTSDGAFRFVSRRPLVLLVLKQSPNQLQGGADR